MPDQPFDEIPYPSSRQFTFDLGHIGREKHHVKALLELDVTEARRRIRLARQSGRSVSFMAWFIKEVADCVALHPPVSGINRPRRNRVVVFQDVDVSLVIEKEVNGTRVPLPYVIRQADRKTPDQITAEIESAKAQAAGDERDYVLGARYSQMGMRLFLALPPGWRIALMKAFVFNDPQRMKAMMGTVMVTTAGMAGHARGWIMPFSMHPLCLAVGSLNEGTLVRHGQIQVAELLHLTVLVDHDAVDGIPAARFVDDLAGRLERAEGL